MSFHDEELPDCLWPQHLPFPTRLSSEQYQPRIFKNITIQDIPMVVGGLLAPGPELPKMLITQVTLERLTYRPVATLVTLGFNQKIRSSEAKESSELVPLLTKRLNDASGKRLCLTLAFHPYGIFWQEGETL